MIVGHLSFKGVIGLEMEEMVYKKKCTQDDVANG